MENKPYTVIITTQAEQQMQEIVKYIGIELKAPQAALSLIDMLETAIDSLSQFPQRIKLTEDEPWRSYGIHKMTIKNFLIYFRIDDENNKVQIIAVIYGKRDQLNQIFKS